MVKSGVTPVEELDLASISYRTKVVATRVENDVYSILERRAKRRGLKVSEYIRTFLTYDARRKR